MVFERIARYCEKTFGVQYDRDEEFFICPECGEPIYKDDWRDSDFLAVGSFSKFKNKFYCPVCENFLVEL